MGRHIRAVMIGLMFAAACPAVAEEATPVTPAGVNPAARPSDEFPYEGVVTGDNVYVRSGPGTNWYPTKMLRKDARVRVIAEEFGWLKIVPPEGSFSYVESVAVERSADSSRGVTQLDGVYVKAGSELSPRKVATQQILPRGVELTILGEDEGFYKVLPPEGSYLYISKQYVRRAGPTDDLARFETMPREEPRPTTPAARPPAEAVTRAPAGRTIPSEVLEQPTTNRKHRAMLETIEADLRSALATPGGTTQFPALVNRYRPIAEQEEDLVARAVARTRIDQLTAQLDLKELVVDATQKRDSLENVRLQLERDRTRLFETRGSAPPPTWDYQGELRRSMAFGGRDDRYRLIDPTTQATIAYIDIPARSGIDASRLIHRYVGIRISGQYFSPSARVPVAVAIEADILPSPMADRRESSAAPAASPLPMESVPASTEPEDDSAGETTDPEIE
jgi:hypothetical protein